MNRLLMAGLIGGAIYWLLKNPGTIERQLRAVGPDPYPDPHIEPEDERNLLDEALEESFPASDPPAITPPKH